MSQFFQIHQDNPQHRLVVQAADIIRKGGVVVYPTDSAYALGCALGDKKAADRIRLIRRLDKHHNFTLMCRDLSELATYAKVDNQTFRMIKNHTPGAFTFILNGTSEVPRRLLNPKRKTIGLRVPDNNIALALLEELGEPIMSTTLIMPDEEYPMTDPYDIRQFLEHAVDLVIDGGYCGMSATTVLDMSGDEVELLRQGEADASDFLS
ncbi:MAG: threonylcarbamoyl-AMP synthase [Cellvibrionaceae bacterium]